MLQHSFHNRSALVVGIYPMFSNFDRLTQIQLTTEKQIARMRVVILNTKAPI